MKACMGVIVATCVLVAAGAAVLSAQNPGVAAPAGAAGANWPFARGTPEGTAVSEQPGPRTEPQVLWRFQSGGPRGAGAMGSMSSTPVVQDGVVYWGSDDGKVYALRAATGDVVWKSAMGEPGDTNNQILGSAAVSEDRVFVGGFTGGFKCLDRATGKTMWKSQINHGYIIVPSSPVVANGMVAFGYDDGMACHKTTGDLVYDRQLPSGYTGIAGEVFGVLTSDGAHVFYGCDNGKVYAQTLTDGTTAWAFEDDFSLPRMTVAVSQDRVFLCYGQTACCLNVKTGGVVWKKVPAGKGAKDAAGGAGLNDPAVGPDYLIVSSDSGKVFRLGKTDGSVTWTFDNKDPGLTSPVVGKDVVYLGAKDKLIALDLKTGRQLWSCKLKGTVSSNLALADGKLYVSGADGALYAVGGR